MCNNWKKTKLSDFIEFNPSLKLSKKTLAKKISMEMLAPFARKITGYEYSNFSGGSKFQNGDTLLARITPCLENGKTSFVDILENDEIAFGSTEFIVLRNKIGSSDKKFIYYLAISPFLRDVAIKSMIGSSGRQRVQQNVLENLEINLPPLETQEKIAKILSSLDDKIELNNKINENLHVQAQAIFKSWFVDFEPFGGTMPSDWEEKSLSDIAFFINGLAMQKFRPKKNEKSLPVLKIKELRAGNCDFSSELCSENIKNDYIVKQGDIIFSWSGSLLVDVWSGGTCGLNQHLFKVIPNSFDNWFVFWWLKFHLNKFIAIANDKATTMGHIKREDLEKAKVLIPNKKVYQELNKILSSLFDNYLLLEIESKKLTQIRDTLLPKLMSGEIEV